MRLRSLLYIPAHRERFLARAATCGADAVILDLEDSVPETEKVAARDGLARWVPELSAQTPVFVRINAGNKADAVAAARAGATALIVPKVGARKDLLAVTLALADADLPPLPLLALIEDPAALLAARRIARAPHLMGLCLGGEDFANALGAEPVAEVLSVPKLMLHYIAKAHGLRSFGLLCSVADYADTDALTSAAQEARRHGFDGATCIHPSAVLVLNDAFTPNASELARATRLVSAMDAALKRGEAAISFEGRMIDAPMYDRARALLSEWAPPAKEAT